MQPLDEEGMAELGEVKVRPGEVETLFPYYPGFVSEDHCLDAVAHAEFSEHLAHMGFDRGLGDEQPCSNLGVRVPRGHLLEHLPLPISQAI